MVVVFLLTLYAAGGVAVFWWYDREQMKKEVPYGEFPAIASLPTVRKVVLGVFMAIGTGALIVLTMELVAELVLHEFKSRIVIFRFNRLLKRLGYKKRIRFAADRKLTFK